MASRIARPYWFRALGAGVPWLTVLRGQLAGVPLTDQGVRTSALTHVGPAVGASAVLGDLVKQLANRPADVALRWACAKELGVPFGPFTVWVRRPTDKPHPIDADVRPRFDGLSIRLHGVAAAVVVDFQPIDTSKSVGLLATYVGGGLDEAVGAVGAAAPASGRTTLTLRTSGMTRLRLVNGTDPKVQVVWLQDVLDSPDWEPFEIVGLPVAATWAGTAYDTQKQGLVSALGSPRAAALARLERGGPPIGYAPLTATGRTVDPPWRAPDPKALVKEVVDQLLPHVKRIYRPGLTPADQAALADSPTVDPPSLGTTTSHLQTTATLSPLATLLLPATSDPFLALATGFGTAYPVSTFSDARLAAAVAPEFLVTADYPDTPNHDGPVQLAAYVPDIRQHAATPAPVDVTTARSGLLAPEALDAAWRESVRVTWDRVRPSAGMVVPTSGVVALYEDAGGPAAVLVPERAAGDRRALVLTPDDPDEHHAGYWRTSMTDADEQIPLGSGGRHVGYPAAVQDWFGVWSRWTDAPWDGTEPGPPGPHLIALQLTSTYAGSTTCPATMTVEVGVDWDTRTPTSVELHTVFFTAATDHDPVPAGVDPVSPAPAGAFRRDLSLPFSGSTLTGPSDVTIVHLNAAGDAAVAPGAAQGDHGRRYRVTIPVPSLDFSATPRWGVKAWARTPLVAVADAGWQPDPAPTPPDVEHPAVTFVASPVPVPPILPPPPPGVPMGSTPDDRGRSHARVHWSVPGGAALDATGGCIVWECAETALRVRAGLPARAADGTLPGLRLQALWDAYDALPPDARRAAFRRLLVLPGTARDADVALPPGTSDIHLFTVTTQTATHVDSDWPTDSPAHLVLQAVAAPRLRRPGAPLVRSVVGAGGTVTLSLSSDSDVPVTAFALYRTRSPEAAMRVETMGPAFAVVAATGPGATPDPVSGLDLYTGTWSGAFDPSWDDWYVRAVAQPVDTVPVEAVRGLPSAASDQVLLRVRPTTPPDLAPLASQVWGGGHDGVLVTTSTSAPARDLPDGVFRLSASMSAAQASGGPADVAPVALGSVPVGPVDLGGGAPAGASSDVLLRSGGRAAGRMPLAVWFTRPVAGSPVDVTVRLVDPLGGESVQTLSVPGWVAATPPSLVVLGVTKVVGRVVLRVASDAPVDAGRPVTMTIVVTPRGRVIGPVVLPVDRGFAGLLAEPVLGGGAAAGGRAATEAVVGRAAAGGKTSPVSKASAKATEAAAARIPIEHLDPGQVLVPVGRQTLTIRLDQIPTVAKPSTASIQVVRAAHTTPQEYDVLIRVATPFTVAVALDAADGGHAQVAQAVP